MKRVAISTNVTVDSEAQSVLDALKNEPRWHAIHLEYEGSGKTGKFYRIYFCETRGGTALTVWGARPDSLKVMDTLFNYGDRGQKRVVTHNESKNLLKGKLAKGYHVVAEATFNCAKNATPQLLANTFDAVGRNNVSMSYHSFDRYNPDREMCFPSSPQWIGWKY